MSTPFPQAAAPQASPSFQDPRHPWLRLLLVMTVPVLLLLVGISLTR